MWEYSLHTAVTVGRNWHIKDLLVRKMDNAERDIPKKLKRYRRFMGTIFDLTFCPVCEQTIPDNGKVINYCSFCGQRLLQKEWEFGD